MPTIDLNDDELAALVAGMRRLLADDKYPLAPRLRPLRAALAKLDPVAEPIVVGRPPLRSIPKAARPRAIRRR